MERIAASSDKPRRYYVSSKPAGLPTSRSKDAIRRVPAPAIEEFLLGRLKQHDPSVVSVTELSTRIVRVSLRADSVRVLMTFEADQVRDRHDRKTILARVLAGDEVRFEDDGLHLTAPVRMKFRGGRTWIDVPDGVTGYQARKVDPVLIGGLRRGHAALAEHNATPQRPPETFQDAFGPASPYVAKLYRLAFLAPDIQRAMLDGLQPRGLTLQQLLDAEIPVAWCDQRAMLGFPSA